MYVCMYDSSVWNRTLMEPTILEHTTIKQSIMKLTSQDLCPLDDSDCLENNGDDESAN